MKKKMFLEEKEEVGWLVGFYGISTFVGLFNATSILYK